MTLTRDRRTELLGGCRLFSGLSGEQLAAIAEIATEVQFPAQRTIVRQGEIGTGFFVVSSSSPGSTATAARISRRTMTTRAAAATTYAPTPIAYEVEMP